MTIRNPFKNDMLRRQFAACLKCYAEKHRDLVTSDGNRCRGNSWAVSFWRGYDGSIPASRWDRASRETFEYACYRAGAAVRATEGDQPLYPAST